jgi:lysosomal acid lipase/cholesteryl ester hydrolase
VTSWFLWTALTIGGWLVCCALLRHWASAPPEGDEQYVVETSDGWTLTLRRFHPKAGVAKQPVPLVLAHGLNMNRGSWALGKGASLIRSFSDRGHETFTVEYRGTSSSSPPPGQSRWRYDIDDHIDRDIPALLGEIERLTGTPQVHWVGHSMGGMLLYLYAGRHGGDRVRRAVTLGSPVRFRLPYRIPSTLANPIVRRLFSGTRVPLVTFAFLTLPFVVAFKSLLTSRFLNPKHLSGRLVGALHIRALENVSGPIYGFFLRLASEQRALAPPSSDSRDDANSGALERFNIPLLVVSGQLDGVAPPAAVVPAFEQVGSTTAAYRCFGGPTQREEAPPFGHCDLASSQAAVQWIVPLIASWFEGPQPRAPGADRTRGLEETEP